MAKQVIVNLIDDLDHSLTAEETVTFGVDGDTYEIDLSAKNAQKLRDAIRPFQDCARRSTPAMRAARRLNTPTQAEVDERARIREWAQKSGVQMSSRGRIPADVVTAYRKSKREGAGDAESLPVLALLP